ncbi:MAG TPA: glyoxylate/hydroxypyruvate reductase A [Steroidobacteraceae bacterium]|nr:glyoxylate/hydroxypyruvate reductase A [Steroidobacteraceae bacterium]
MRITVAHHNPASCQRWRDALAHELPEADVDIWGGGRPGSADYAIAWAAPPEDFFAQHDRLKALFCTGAGVEKLLSSPAVPSDIPVIRLEDAGMGAQMAHYCVYSVLQWLRRRDEYEAQQRARVWKQLPMNDVADWPVGVFGLGVLGLHVAAAFGALGFTVNGFARSAHHHPGVRSFAEQGGAGDFAAFMRASRVLVIIAPLTAATQDRFNRETLALLPPSSYVINVARGGLLVEEALLDLLDNGHIAGAALDVFREEPLPQDHPFWTHPKVRITPHSSAITVIAPSARQVAEKVRLLERGESVSGIVDRSRGY